MAQSQTIPGMIEENTREVARAHARIDNAAVDVATIEKRLRYVEEILGLHDHPKELVDLDGDCETVAAMPCPTGTTGPRF